MLAATVANGGRLMKPYLVQDVKAPDLTTVQQAKPTQLSQPVSAKNAGQLKQMMLSVVNSPNGTAYIVPGIHDPGLNIAAKTGTAQNGTNNTGLNDAVFTALAPAPNPSIAIGVIIKGGGYGAAAAGPIAVQVIKAYLNYPGALVTGIPEHDPAGADPAGTEAAVPRPGTHQASPGPVPPRNRRPTRTCGGRHRAGPARPARGPAPPRNR